MAENAASNPIDYGVVAYVLAAAILEELSKADVALYRRVVANVMDSLENDGPPDNRGVLAVARQLFNLPNES